MLTRLIYASRLARQLNPADIRAIIDSSVRNNAKVGVTGMLYFGKNHFFQCLEGERPQVNDTYNRIVPDERHKEVTVTGYREIKDRLFKDWDMAYLDPEDPNIKNLIGKYSQDGLFQADKLDNDSAENLIQDFSQALKEAKRVTF